MIGFPYSQEDATTSSDANHTVCIITKKADGVAKSRDETKRKKLRGEKIKGEN